MQLSFRRHFMPLLAWIAGFALLLGLSAPALALSAGAASGRAVRVALPRQAGLADVGTAGDYLGYTYEYLEQIVQYTGWDCEYVTFDDLAVDEAILHAMDMVAAGELDLIGGMLKTQATEERFSFSENSYGVVYTTLSVPENSIRIGESNFREMTPLRVAVYEKAATRNAEIEDYLRKENVQYELIPCASTQEQAAALERGEADAISGNSLSYFAGTRAIAKFAAKPYYFATSKGNTALLDELDRALDSIAYAFPYFQTDLQNKYFGTVSTGFSLTDQQRALFQEKNRLKVLCMPDSAPFVMQDAAGECSGVLAALMNDFAAQAGLTLSYDWFPYGADFETFYRENGYDIVLGLPVNTSYSSKLGLITSRAIDSLDILAFRKAAGSSKPLSECTAVLISGSEMADDIACKDILFVDTVRQCVQAVNSGAADVGYANRSSVSYYSYDIFANLVTTPQVGYKSKISIALSRELDNEYVAALNGYIRNISDDMLAEYYEQANVHNQKNVIERMARANPLQAIALCSLFVSVLFAAVLLTASNLRRKKQYLLLQRANAAKSDFLSNMSHEIRTPMNAIIGMTALAQGEVPAGSQARAYLDQIGSSSRYLLGILNEILDMSRIESGKLLLNKDWISPAALLQPCIAMISPAMEAKHITFHFSAALQQAGRFEYFVDALKTRQMLMNLLNNACKFTGDGGEITLSIRHIGHDGSTGSDEISIADNGCGMSEEFLQRIFHPFEQENNIYTGSVQGTGLGLALSKKIAQEMGGDIRVKSELGKGSTFTVLFPYQYRLTHAAPREPGENSDAFVGLLRGQRILMAEDHPLNALIAQKLLEKCGSAVTHAKNGAEALDFFAQSPPHTFCAILMDIRMPVMDGLAAAAAIRGLDRADAQTVPIIAMSANAYAEDVEKSLAAGMNFHLAKPIEPELLYQTLSREIAASLKRED